MGARGGSTWAGGDYLRGALGSERRGILGQPIKHVRTHTHNLETLNQLTVVSKPLSLLRFNTMKSDGRPVAARGHGRVARATLFHRPRPKRPPREWPRARHLWTSLPALRAERLGLWRRAPPMRRTAACGELAHALSRCPRPPSVGPLTTPLRPRFRCTSLRAGQLATGTWCVTSRPPSGRARGLWRVGNACRRESFGRQYMDGGDAPRASLLQLSQRAARSRQHGNAPLFFSHKRGLRFRDWPAAVTGRTAVWTTDPREIHFQLGERTARC